MTTFEKAMNGDGKSIEKVFFGSGNGRNLSDAECDIIFNVRLGHVEQLRRLSVVREAQSFRPKSRKRNEPQYVPFDSLLTGEDTLRARALGVRLD